MKEALGFLPKDEKYVVIPFLKKLELTWPDFLEWTETIDLAKQIQVLKMIFRDKERFMKDTMWGFPGYAAFRDTPDQKARRYAQDQTQAQTPEELLAKNHELAQKYGFNLIDTKVFNKEGQK